VSDVLPALLYFAMATARLPICLNVRMTAELPGINALLFQRVLEPNLSVKVTYAANIGTVLICRCG